MDLGVDMVQTEVQKLPKRNDNPANSRPSGVVCAWIPLDHGIYTLSVHFHGAEH